MSSKSSSGVTASRPSGLPKSTSLDVGERFVALCDVMAALRSPEGCPWDRAQSVVSLRRYLLEEAHEVADVIDAMEGDTQEGSANSEKHARHHCGELGDLLLQIVFQSQIQKEENNFDAGDVCDAITAKMLRRHPHIFDDHGAIKGLENREPAPSWEEIKAEERRQAGDIQPGVVQNVPRSHPPLVRAMRTGEKAHKVGFDWPDYHGVIDKIDEEVIELKEALADDDNAAVESEIGDLLYAIVNLCRHRSIDPGRALNGTIDRFGARFHLVEQALAVEDLRPQDCSLEDLERRWQHAKSTIAAAGQKPGLKRDDSGSQVG